MSKDEGTITIRWSDEENCYVARSSTYAGAVGIGSTITEAASVIEDAINGIEETLKHLC